MKPKKLASFLVPAVAILGLATYFGVSYLGAHRDARYLRASGTVEARDIRVGSKVGGRIQEVKVREGDNVEAGQILVAFEDQELLAALEEARAGLEKMESGYRPEEIAEARAAEAQARADYDQKLRGYRPEDIEAARAEVERTRAEALRAEASYRRLNDLTTASVVSKDQRDDAEGTYKAAQAALEGARAHLAELENGYLPEEVTSAEEHWRQAKAVRELRERGNRSEDIAIARARLRDAETRYRERQVLAPAQATVEVLDVRPGDLIPPNTPIATLLERDQLYIRVYVPETQVGRVMVGQKAEVRVDSFPGESFAAEVEQVNQKAEFLPRNVQTLEERAHQVFGVKLRVRDPSGRIRAGMAADVKLEIAEG